MTEPRQTIRFTTSFDGVRIAYAVTGKGPPLVRAPTLLTHVEYDWQSTMSRHWVSELSSRHTYLRLDPRAVGASQWDVADLSFEAIVKDLAAVVDAAGFERFDLLGTSFGPAVAIAYAARHPERVGDLFLYGSYCRGSLKRDPTSEQIERALLYVKLAELGWAPTIPRSARCSRRSGYPVRARSSGARSPRKCGDRSAATMPRASFAHGLADRRVRPRPPVARADVGAAFERRSARAVRRGQAHRGADSGRRVRDP